MENKTTILNIALGVLLVLSLIINGILFNQFYIAKQTLVSIKSQLDNSKVQLKNAQSDWHALQTRLTDAQKENAKLLASKNEQSVSVDGSKMLSSGMTLYEVKQLIDTNSQVLQKKGYSKEQINSTNKALAISLGTTIDEVLKIKAPVPEQSTPPNKPSSGSNQGSGSSGSGQATSWDKNGDGINDDFQGGGSAGVDLNKQPGTTTPDNIGLGSGNN